jgi:hypothetical protein
VAGADVEPVSETASGPLLQGLSEFDSVSDGEMVSSPGAPPAP